MRKITQIETYETREGVTKARITIGKKYDSYEGVFEKETRIVDLENFKAELERTGLATVKTEIVEVPRDYPLSGLSADQQLELEIAYLQAAATLWAVSRHEPLAKTIEELNERIATKLGL